MRIVTCFCRAARHLANASNFTNDVHTHTNRMESTPRRAPGSRELDRAIQVEDTLRVDAVCAPDRTYMPAVLPTALAGDEPSDLCPATSGQPFELASTSSMKSVFDNERGRGAMLVMAGGVIDQATTVFDTAAEAAAAAEYRPGDPVVHGGDQLYEIESILGEGAFGAVYKAVATDGGATLALKSIKPDRLTPENFRDAQVTLAAESAICFVIGLHPHIVSVHRVLSTPKGLLIALDYVQGTDLRGLAGKSYNGPLYKGGRAEANRRVDSIVAQLFKGLAHLHSRAVLHQDIKPDTRARAVSSLFYTFWGSVRRLSLRARAAIPLLLPPRRI